MCNSWAVASSSRLIRSGLRKRKFARRSGGADIERRKSPAVPATRSAEERGEVRGQRSEITVAAALCRRRDWSKPRDAPTERRGYSALAGHRSLKGKLKR